MQASFRLVALPLLVLWTAASLNAQVVRPETPPDTGVTVFLDNDALTLQQTYELEKDMTYQLKAYHLKPNSDIKVKIKFTGLLGLGSKSKTKTADDTGTFRMLFDTPNRKAGAKAIVAYTAANGNRHQRTFKMKVR